MQDQLSRRQLLIASTGAAASLAGCQRFLESEVSVVVQIHNITERRHEPYLEFNTGSGSNSNTYNAVTGEVESGQTVRYNLSVDPNTYNLEITLDDVDPRPVKTIQWEITEDMDDCDKNKDWILTTSDTSVDIKQTSITCEDSPS